MMSEPVLNAKPNALITCAPGSSYTHVMAHWIPKSVPHEYRVITWQKVLIEHKWRVLAVDRDASTGSWLKTHTPKTPWNLQVSLQISPSLRSNLSVVDTRNRQAWARAVLSKRKSTYNMHDHMVDG
jgi:hypothetical protein